MLFEKLLVLLTKPPVKDEYDLHAMGNYCHKILVSLVRTELTLDSKVASIVEQVLAIHMVDSEHHVRSSNLFTQRCAQMQRVQVSALVHCAVLNGFETDYAISLHTEEMEEQGPSDAIDSSDPTSEPLSTEEIMGDEIAELDEVAASDSATSLYLSHLSERASVEGLQPDEEDLTANDFDSDGLEDDGLMDDEEDSGVKLCEDVTPNTSILA